MFYYTEYLSPVGLLTLVSTGEAITGLWIAGQKYYFSTVTETPVREDRLAVFTRAREWLSHYFAGEQPSPSTLPLDPAGSPFRKAVWEQLCEIPYGSVTTYGAIAQKLAFSPNTAPVKNRGAMSAQAVGGAVAHNPISIIIPCHRVIGADGSLTGYAGGLDKKCLLLTLEGVDQSILKL